MVSINYATKEVSCKIVYYGPGLSGKTTNLQYVHQKVPQNTRGKLISLATEADRTLYFDFLPINIGSINGFAAKFQLYTVPGQVYYNATRKLVLRGVDGVVFVADAQAEKMDDNQESLENLKENLTEYGYDIDMLPIVIQYNKSDLPTALPQVELDAKLNTCGWPSFMAAAVKGVGVFDTLKMVMKLVLEKAKRGGTRPAAMKTDESGMSHISENAQRSTSANMTPLNSDPVGVTPPQRNSSPATLRPAQPTYEVEPVRMDRIAASAEGSEAVGIGKGSAVSHAVGGATHTVGGATHTVGGANIFGSKRAFAGGIPNAPRSASSPTNPFGSSGRQGSDSDPSLRAGPLYSEMSRGNSAPSGGSSTPSAPTHLTAPDNMTQSIPPVRVISSGAPSAHASGSGKVFPSLMGGADPLEARPKAAKRSAWSKLMRMLGLK